MAVPNGALGITELSLKTRDELRRTLDPARIFDKGARFHSESFSKKLTQATTIGSKGDGAWVDSHDHLVFHLGSSPKFVRHAFERALCWPLERLRDV